MGVGPGDEVIVPSNTYIATWLAVTRAGADGPCRSSPTRATSNIDPDRLEAAVTPRTRAILPVHLYGLAGRHGRGPRRSPSATACAVLEDAAQAHGARHRGAAAGGARRRRRVELLPEQEPRRASATAARSPPTTPRVAERAALAAQLRLARRSTSTTSAGFNSRLDELQAALLSREARPAGRVERPPPRDRGALPGRPRRPADRPARRRRAGTSGTSSPSARRDRDALAAHLAEARRRRRWCTTRSRRTSRTPTATSACGRATCRSPRPCARDPQPADGPAPARRRRRPRGRRPSAVTSPPMAEAAARAAARRRPRRRSTSRSSTATEFHALNLRPVSAPCGSTTSPTGGCVGSLVGVRDGDVADAAATARPSAAPTSSATPRRPPTSSRCSTRGCGRARRRRRPHDPASGARPAFYSGSETAVQFALLNLGFRVEACELSFHIDLEALDGIDDYVAGLRSPARRALRHGLAEPFALLEAGARRTVGRRLPHARRQPRRQGPPPGARRSTTCAPRATRSRGGSAWPCSSTAGAPCAAALTYRVLPGRELVVYWGDAGTTCRARPMNVLAHRLVERALAEGRPQPRHRAVERWPASPDQGLDPVQAQRRRAREPAPRPGAGGRVAAPPAPTTRRSTTPTPTSTAATRWRRSAASPSGLRPATGCWSSAAPPA